MTEPGPQKQPASVNQIEAQVRQAKRELATTSTHKPCPWCRTAEYLTACDSPSCVHYWVRCHGCMCEGPLEETEDEAWQAWDAMGDQQTDENGRPMTY